MRELCMFVLSNKVSRSNGRIEPEVIVNAAFCCGCGEELLVTFRRKSLAKGLKVNRKSY